MKTLDKSGLSAETIEYISSLEEDNQTLEADNQKLSAKVDSLTQALDKLQRMQFGRSSEKTKYLSEEELGQLTFFNEAEAVAEGKEAEPAAALTVKAHKRKPKRTKEELMKDLPVKEVICELPDTEKSCDICNGHLRPLGKEVVRKELEVIPKQVRVLEYTRHNYVCEACEKETGDAHIVKAPVPEPVIKHSMASPSAVADVMYQKYVNAMP